jgi:RNA polymerase sigma-54 factor
MRQVNSLKVTQQQKQALIHSPQMNQALKVLQMPVMELGAYIEREIEENPILEYSEEERNLERLEILRDLISSSRFKKGAQDAPSFENQLPQLQSLFDVLINQARQSLNEEDLEIATLLIGELDEDGFMVSDLNEMALLHDTSVETLERLLKEIQKFDPPGVGAKCLQDSLLIQLKAQGKQSSLCFMLIRDHYHDLLHNRLPLISKKTNQAPSIIKKCIEKEMIHLDCHPGKKFGRGHYEEVVHAIRPDLCIIGHEGTIVVNDGDTPKLRINPSYLSYLKSQTIPEETKEYIYSKIQSGKWLMRNINERHNTLYRIAEQIIELQKEFFSNQNGHLNPLTMKEVASKLSLHESTVARAVSNKYLSCERGVLPLRFFFTHSMSNASGETISNSSIKEEVRKIVASEEKRRPLSDEMISKKLKERGFTCARRTVSKYREELGIASATKRKSY